MKKISNEELRGFDEDVILILSKKRLEGYGGDLKKHYKNLSLALEAGKRIAILEIYLRNKLDFCLKIREGEGWIKDKKSLELIRQKGNTPLEELDTHQVLSSLMLGEIVGLINLYKIEHYIFDLRDMDFKKYHWSNRNFFYLNGRKNHLSNVSKVSIALNLLRNIRNRAFHWENLLKVTIKRNGDIFPRITHKEGSSTIGIMPEMILEFLDDLLECVNQGLMSKIKGI